jgi:hypothetical protein
VMQPTLPFCSSQDSYSCSSSAAVGWGSCSCRWNKLRTFSKALSLSCPPWAASATPISYALWCSSNNKMTHYDTHDSEHRPWHNNRKTALQGGVTASCDQVGEVTR